MSDRNNPRKNAPGNKPGPKVPPAKHRRSPIILVHATPSPPLSPGRVPTTIEDERTLTLPAQPTQMSYANVAARLGTTNRATNAPAAPSASTAPAANVLPGANDVSAAAIALATVDAPAVQPTLDAPSAQTAAATATPAAAVQVEVEVAAPAVAAAYLAHAAAEVVAVPTTPIIHPMPTRPGDVLEHLELPPPAAPWQGANAMSPNGTAGAGNVTSPLSSGSPIYVPSTASATPTPDGDAGAAIGTATVPRSTNEQEGSSAADFWAHFRTPDLPDSNLPSALQTPRILVDQINSSRAPSSSTLTGQPTISSTILGAVDRENRPPAGSTDAELANSQGHWGFLPPATPSTMASGTDASRKRRRSNTPASGERARKLARRKAKAAARRPEPAFRMEDPWRSTRLDSRPLAFMPPSTSASAAFPIPSQSPRSDQRRSLSASTSNAGRFNQSGSYPTPHHMSDMSSTTPTRHSRYSSQGSSRQDAMEQDSERITRMSSAASSLPSSDANWFAECSSALTEPSPNQLARSGARDVTMGEASRPSSSASRQRLQDLRADPSSTNERAGTYRSLDAGSIPEDGELNGSRFSAAGNAFDWDRYSTSHGGPTRDVFTSTPFESTPRSAWDDADPRIGRQREREAVATPFLEGMDGLRANEWHSRTPRRMARDEEIARHYSPRSAFAPRGSPPHLRYRNAHPGAWHSNGSAATPSSRINSLDVFDVGVDDNLPEAVRRGGATTEGEDERPTPIALEGDPEVHRHDPEAHLRGMSDEWVQEVWSDPTGTSITLSTFNPRFTRSYGTNRRTASDIRRAITRITGESSFLVIAPDQAPNHQGRGPVEWAVTGLSRDAVDRLLRRRVWSFRDISFFPRQRALVIPSLLLALEGFLDDNVANIQRAVRSTFERPQVRQRIEQMIRANPAYNNIPIDDAFRRVISTLRITVYTLDNGTVVANVFMTSPTQSVRAWRQWIIELRELTFGSYHTAIARARRISACTGCLGADHPSYLCPFAHMQGWNGPESAGGATYSVDGRERRESQAAASSTTTDSQTNRHARNQPANAQAGPSRTRTTTNERDWENHDYEGARNRGRDRDNDASRRGLARRGRRDGSGPARDGREFFRKGGRR